MELSAEAFVHLASLPLLQMLAADIRKDHINQMSLSAISPQPFPAVCEMVIWIDDTSAVTGFFRALRPTILLQTVYITVDTVTSNTEYRDLFQALVDICSPHTITIERPTYYDSGGHLTGYFLDSLAITPLLLMTHLEVLKINTFLRALHIDDSLLDAMATAWPRLRILQLAKSLHLTPRTTNVTINGLAMLAKCRELTDLSIPFDSSPSLNFHQVEPQTSLFSMTFAMSSLAYPPKVVEFFSQVFPKLSLINAYNDQYFGESGRRMQQIVNWRETKVLFTSSLPQVREGDGVDTH
jgi:hypothetical protein